MASSLPPTIGTPRRQFVKFPSRTFKVERGGGGGGGGTKVFSFNGKANFKSY